MEEKTFIKENGMNYWLIFFYWQKVDHWIENAFINKRKHAALLEKGKVALFTRQSSHGKLRVKAHSHIQMKGSQSLKQNAFMSSKHNIKNSLILGLITLLVLAF